MNILNTYKKVFAIILVLILSGCENQKILTTLAIDRSASNINNANNRKNLVEICKLFVSKMQDTDTLIIKEFDSKPRPSKLDDSLDKPNAKKRNQFKEDKCPTILPDQPATNALPGTDIHSVWIESYRNYDERKKIDSNQQGKTKKVEIIIFYIDYLEPVSQGKEDILNLGNFKTSIQEFISDGNFLLIFIANTEDRESLGKEFDSIIDQEHRLMIIDPSKYKQIIEEVYSKARIINGK